MCQLLGSDTVALVNWGGRNLCVDPFLLLMAGATASLNHEEEIMCSIKMVGLGAGEMTQPRGARVALAETVSLVPRTHRVAHTYLSL